MKPKLVTIVGQRTDILKHQLNHYKDLVSEMHIGIFENFNSEPITEKVLEITKDYNVKIFHRKQRKPYSGAEVTKFYNDIKLLHPNDWWIVADDDEFQVYSKDIELIIDECEDKKHKFVAGGFIDRVGRDGKFEKIEEEMNIWERFPIACSFRNKYSNACSNKITLCKGDVSLGEGQHFVWIDNIEINIKNKIWENKYLYPKEKNFTQVHHFKWDSTVVNRLHDRLIYCNRYNYFYKDENQKMYNSIIEMGNKVDIYQNDLFVQEINSPYINNSDYYTHYTYWDELSKIIQTSFA